MEKWTFIIYFNGTKTQIYFIMVRTKWRNSIRNSEPYNCIGSAHRIISIKIKFSLRAQRKIFAKPTYNWSILKNEKTEYSNMVMQAKGYNELNNVKECNLEPSRSYENVVMANKEAFKETEI